MPYPRHALQSVEIQAVTQVRASDDHVPGSPELPLQWRIGMSSILAWSIGLGEWGACVACRSLRQSLRVLLHSARCMLL
jgi:hypothetical protein